MLSSETLSSELTASSLTLLSQAFDCSTIELCIFSDEKELCVASLSPQDENATIPAPSAKTNKHAIYFFFQDVIFFS